MAMLTVSLFVGTANSTSSIIFAAERASPSVPKYVTRLSLFVVAVTRLSARTVSNLIFAPLTV